MTREEIAKKFVPCRCDVAYTSRGMTAPDCPFHSTDPEAAMDEYGTQMCLELLEYLGKHEVECLIRISNEKPIFLFKGEWITKEQLFENFL